ncbi:MAG: hypothetical protein AAF483_17380 [Planctomycetota bacterium]
MSKHNIGSSDSVSVGDVARSDFTGVIGTFISELSSQFKVRRTASDGCIGAGVTVANTAFSPRFSFSVWRAALVYAKLGRSTST